MKRFLAAAAMAPLCFAAMEARAQTTVSDARTTAVQTSATGDLTIATTGSVTVTSGAAVTVDSASTVINNGSITIKDSTTPATGILITSPSATITNNSIINITDSETLKDSDGDGDLDGPYVSATTPRFGIRAPSLLTGDVSFGSGQILIRGNNSAAISLEGGLTGNYIQRGSSVLVGANSYALRIGGPVVGNLDIGGTNSVQGQGSEAISIAGPVSGRIILGGTTVATGFRYTTTNLPFALSKLDADDLLVGGPGVRIAGSVTGGVLVNATQPNTDNLNPDNDTSTPDITDPNPDEDGDGLTDANETDGTITSYGSAPGLLIAGPSAITLGNVGTGQSAYGLSIQGTVVGNGLFDGFSATAVQLGGGGGTVDTTGGVSVSGTVFGGASLADARGMVFASGVTAPTLAVSGRLQAGSTSSASVAPNTIALQIDSGATVGSINNSGTIQAGIRGVNGTAIGVLDNSGSVGSITNSGLISASLAKINEGDIIVGRGIALDLRANTGGLTLLQTHNTDETITPTIIGDVLFGSGGTNLQILEGSITGDVAFGAGANSLLINGTRTTHDSNGVATTVVNGTITGKVTNAGTLGVSVLSGALNNQYTGQVNLTDLTVGSAGKLGFTLNPQGSVGATGTRYVVAGGATLANGSQIDISFASKLINSQTFNLISAGSLANLGLDTSLLGDTPFFYKSALTSNGTDLNLTVARRTAEEAGLADGPASAYEAIFGAFDADEGVARSLLSKTDEAGFKELYDQFLPDYSGGGFQSLAKGTRSVMRAQADEPAGMNTNQRRSWLQEIGFSTSNDSKGGDVEYDTAGFGLAGGIESAMRNGQVWGWSAAFISSDIDDDNRRGFSKLTASALLGSVYWRDQIREHLVIDASATGGYAWFDSDRHVVDTDPDGARILQRQAGGKWDGAVAAARMGAKYEIPLGRYYVSPDVVLDYVYVYEDGYTEHGGGPSVDLAVQHRTSYEAAVEAGLSVGAHFGRGFRWTPELHVGYRSSLASNYDDTVARFLAGGDFFALRALGVDKGRVIVRASIRGGSRYANVAFEVGGDIGSVYTAYDGRLVVRFIF